jgi:hypothetical protein
MPFIVDSLLAIEWPFAFYDFECLSHPLHLDGQFLKVEQSMKHHAVLGAVRPLTLDATGNSNDAMRNTGDACYATDIDFSSITVIDGAVNELDHWASPKLSLKGPLSRAG